jgi:hypothetical protein
MIADSILIYLLFQIILLMINILGYTKIPMLFFFGIIGTIVLAVPTIQAFGEYYLMAIILILINISLPVTGLAKLK